MKCKQWTFRGCTLMHTLNNAIPIHFQICTLILGNHMGTDKIRFRSVLKMDWHNIISGVWLQPELYSSTWCTYQTIAWKTAEVAKAANNSLWTLHIILFLNSLGYGKVQHTFSSICRSTTVGKMCKLKRDAVKNLLKGNKFSIV